jgi:hypothetical protein
VVYFAPRGAVCSNSPSSFFQNLAWAVVLKPFALFLIPVERCANFLNGSTGKLHAV